VSSPAADPCDLPAFPTRRSSDLQQDVELFDGAEDAAERMGWVDLPHRAEDLLARIEALRADLSQRGLRMISLAGMGGSSLAPERSEEHTSELQSRFDLVCRLLLE